MIDQSVKIAIVTNRFPSVSETFIAIQIAGLVNNGFRVTVVSIGPPKGKKPVDINYAPPVFRQIADKVQIFRTKYNINENAFLFTWHFIQVFFITLARNPIAFIKCLPLLYKGSSGIKKFKNFLYDSEVLDNVAGADILHCQFADLADRVAYANKLGSFQTKVPIVFSARGFDITQKSVVKNIDWKLLIKRCSVAMPVCHYFKQQLLQNGWDASKIHVVPSAVDVKKCLQIVKSKQEQIDNQLIKIISVGRLTEKKGFSDAIDAIMLLSKSFELFQYDIIGEGEQFQVLKQKIKNYGLEQKVRMLGKMPTDKTLQAMAESNILLAPSKTAADGNSEGIPNVIKEAMLLGLQVVATRHSGIPEIVIDDETGMLVNEQSPEEIKAAIEKLVNDKASWIRRSETARALISQNFSPETSFEKLLEAYEASLQRGKYRNVVLETVKAF